MARPTKINREFLSRVSELYTLGYPLSEVAKLLDVHPETISRYLRKDPEYKEKMEKLRGERLRGVIERGLQTLAEGTEVVETTEVYYIEDAQGDKKKIMKTTKTLPPNVKAIEVLARKYESVFSNKEMKQINNLIMTENPISMRELLEYKDSKDNPINAEYKEVNGED